ncbi:MAG TPA: radical SAM protein, partial [Desulfomonilaceae bacterium]|nr:radical SAM protein [Desulfomonilaceae bacterium]
MNEHKNRKQAIVYVLGCKVNQAEAAAITGILEDNGYDVDQASDHPDLVLVNTCCVTSKAEGKSRRAVKRLRDKYPSARLVVTGCLAEINAVAISRIAEDSIILGTAEKDRFQDYIRSPEERNGEPANAAACITFADLGFREIQGRSRSFLKIQDGCSQRCSYCIVPIARGPSRSMLPSVVVEHAKRNSAMGFAEVVLTGIHLGHYG